MGRNCSRVRMYDNFMLLCNNMQRAIGYLPRRKQPLARAPRQRASRRVAHRRNDVQNVISVDVNDSLRATALARPTHESLLCWTRFMRVQEEVSMICSSKQQFSNISISEFKGRDNSSPFSCGMQSVCEARTRDLRCGSVGTSPWLRRKQRTGLSVLVLDA